MAKSKIVSFRVPYEAYAEILIKCSKSNIDISDHARERFFYDSEQSELEQKRLSSELDLCMVSLDQSIKDVAALSERLQEAETEQNRLSNELDSSMLALELAMADVSKLSEKTQEQDKELAQVKKELNTCKDANAAQIEKLKKATEDDKAEIKRLAGLYNELGTSAAKNIEKLENDLKNALERIKKANAYCVENEIGTGIFKGNQIVQF